jgi:ATP-dependent Clp protease ATP-binding subunit ClpB
MKYERLEELRANPRLVMTRTLAWALDFSDRTRLALRLSLGGFTENAMNALLAARAEAIRLNHRDVAAGHVLLGLSTNRNCAARTALNRLGVDLGRDVDTITASVGTPEAALPHGRPVLNAEVNGLLGRARAEARRSGASYVGTEHLILAVLAGGGSAAEYLERRGITRQSLTDVLRSQD